MIRKACGLALAAILAPPPSASQIHERQFEEFTVWVDCSLRGAVRFEYTALADVGHLPTIS